MKIIIIMLLCALVAWSTGCIGTNERIEEASPINVPISSAASVPDPTPTPEKVGTYINPVPMEATLISDTRALNMGIIIVRRGYSVASMVANENMFNAEPTYGNEYMLVCMYVTYNKMNHLDNDEKFLLSSHDFTAYVDGVECNIPWVVLPDEIDVSASINMMPGSNTAIWMIFEVPKNEQVIVSYDRLFVESTYYFDAGSSDYIYGLSPEPEQSGPRYSETPNYINPPSTTRTASGHHIPNPTYDDLPCPEELSKYDRSHDGNLSMDELRKTKNAYILNDLSSEQITAYKEIKDWYM